MLGFFVAQKDGFYGDLFDIPKKYTVNNSID